MRMNKGTVYSLSVASTFCTLFCLMNPVQVANAHVRQRVFLNTGANESEGKESIIHWENTSPIRLSMYDFGTAGKNLQNSSLTFSTVQGIMGSSLTEWKGSSWSTGFGTFGGYVLPLTFD